MRFDVEALDRVSDEFLTAALNPLQWPSVLEKASVASGSYGINVVPIALLTRQMRFVLTARNEIIATLCGAVVTVVCALKGFSYWSLVAGQFALLVIGNILGWLAVGWRPSR